MIQTLFKEIYGLLLSGYSPAMQPVLFGATMSKLKPPPIRVDWLALAAHDPSILTFRRCTGDDIRRLAPLVPMPLWRARRAFNYKLFYHPQYLTLSLDPAFEPQEPIRLRAQLMLDQKLLVPPTQAKPKPVAVVPPTQPKPKLAINRKPSRITRYSFD